ncbi:YD repeat-containing protein, partial [Melghirimyces profundicolus]
MRKKGTFSKRFIWLFLFIFVFGSIQPTPVLAAEEIHNRIQLAAVTKEPGFLDKAINFLKPDGPQVQPAQEEERGFWDTVEGYLGLDDPGEEKGTARATDVLPRKEKAPKGEKMAQPKRVKELKKKRTATAKFYELEDGRQQVEVSSSPVHYRDDKGNWKEIDTRIQDTNKPGFSYGNEKNTFQSFFGKKSDQLVKFQLKKRHLTLGVKGKEKKLTPETKDNTITYPDVFGEADLVYDVTPTSLKEKIILEKAPEDATYTFTVKMGGVEAKKQKDGSIAFYRKSGEGDPVFIMPKPFMMDDKDDPSSPYGKVWSDKVTQSVEQKGSHIEITVKADEKWLKSDDRKYPVVIDPTIKVEPTPTDGQDAMVINSSGSSDTNFGDNWKLSVGTTDTYAARSLVKFKLPQDVDGKKLDAAQLKLYYDQWFHTNTNDVGIEARPVTVDWDESTVTWNTVGDNYGAVGYNRETVDNEPDNCNRSTYPQTCPNDEAKWPQSTSSLTQYAVDDDYQYNNDSTAGDTYTWIPRLTEDGKYRVKAHYVQASDRGIVPYTVHYNGGQQTYQVDQSQGSTRSQWADLGEHSFVAGTTHKVVLGDDPGNAAIADAVQWTKYATDTKKAGEQNTWHTFSVRNIVQDWIDGKQANYGFMLKASDETLGKGGPRYEASEYAYNGESANRPKLVLTFGKPGVHLDDPTKIHATGAELNWSAYQDPDAGTTDDDIVEYQVHRSVDQTFTPGPATLVAPVDPGTTQYTDTTAEPTPADDPEPFGNAYYYMVAVKTKDGSLIPSPTRLVRLPKAGRVVEIFQGNAADTTIASGQPDQNHDVLAGHPWLEVGNNSSTYGNARAILKFNTDTLPADADILDAELNLWTSETYGSGGTYDLHALTTDFVEMEATWNNADAATPWTTGGGGDYDAAVSDSVSSITSDPKWHRWNAGTIVQQWVDDPASNHGFLVKRNDEAGAGERVLFLSSEAEEKNLRPKLVVTYTERTTANTYYAPKTPARMIPGDQYTVEVTLTNTTDITWSAADYVLSYHWALPDGTDKTTEGNRLETELRPVQSDGTVATDPVDVAPGETITVQAKVKTPIQSDSGNKREAFVLKWDMRNKTTGQWLSEQSTTDDLETLDQNVTVEDPTSDELGLEKFYQYVGKNTGAGSTVMVNQYAGNTVFGYNPFSNPSRGLATFLRITYNSLDTSDSSMGYGWSLSATSLMRLGTPLDLHPKGQDWPTEVTLTDGDGTSHIFELKKPDTTDETTWYYDSPAGVHFYLQKDGSKEERQWVMTRPDRTRFFFDGEGFLSAIRDKNGNEMLFTYEEKKSRNKPVKFLKYITDPASRQTLTLEYYQKGEDYTYFDEDTKTQGTNLTNPKIIDQVKSITDLSGRKITFTYSDKGLMREMVDGAGIPEAKTFGFTYDATNTNKNTKLVTITDPRGNATNLDYYMPSDTETTQLNKWRLQTLTDREGGNTAFTYTDPDGTTGSYIESTVTDANGKATQYRMDGFGRPEKTTNAKGEITQLSWDDDNNVTRLEEANGAVTTWTYDAKTGYPLEVKDAEANDKDTAATKLYYQTDLSGYVADLTKKVSPEGRTWTFAYDTVGNLTTVTDPMGNATPTEPDDYQTTYTYDPAGQLLTATDANGNTTTYSNYHPTGYPETITDALGNATTTAYDERGNVVSITDAKGKESTYTYDVFGRPLEQKEPKDQDAGEYIITPAPVYDKNDNITKETAPNGAVTTYTYDKADQMVATTAPKDEATDPERKTTYAYDLVGNLLKQTEPKGNLTTSDPDDFVTTYGYDDIYQLKTVTNADGDTITYDYDNVGNVVKVLDPKKTASSDTTDYTTKIDYDLNHRVIKETDAEGHSTQYTYDLDGNKTSVTDKEGNTTDIAYDERGMVQEVKVPHKDDGGTITYRTTQYVYDEVGNRTKVITPRGVETTGEPDDFIHETKYDALNRVKEQIFPHDGVNIDDQAKMVYTYDEVGNRVKVSAPPSDGQTDPDGGALRNVTTYDYFDNGWVKKSVDPWNITTSYDYNELGQQTSRTLTSAGGSNSRTMGWSYTPDGKLKAKSDDGIPVGKDVVLVDNSDTQNVEFAGDWKTSNNVDGHQGYSYQYDYKDTGYPDSDTDNHYFTWKLNVPKDGDYEVWVSYQKYKDRATNAPYTIEYDGGSTTVEVNQNVASGSETEWKKLGTYAFKAGNTHKITLKDDAD